MSERMVIVKNLKSHIRRNLALLSIAAVAGTTLGTGSIATAEFGDVIMNSRCDEAGMAPVVFPHWFHRIRFRCKVCHGDLGFALKAGGNDVTMLSIIDGQYCGACHDGGIAWAAERCDLCHSGKPGLATQVHNGRSVKLASPPHTRGGPPGK